MGFSLKHSESSLCRYYFEPAVKHRGSWNYELPLKHSLLYQHSSQHIQAIDTKNSQFNFSVVTSWASLSQCSAECHWCPAYILFKDLLFIVAPRKLLIRPSEGWGKDLIVKALSKDVCMVHFQSSSWLTKQKGTALRGTARSILHLWTNHFSYIYTGWKHYFLHYLWSPSFTINSCRELRPLPKEQRVHQKTRHLPQNIPDTQVAETLHLSLSLERQKTATGQCYPAPLPHLVLTSISTKPLPSAHILVG